MGTDCPFHVQDSHGHNYTFSFCNRVPCGEAAGTAVCQTGSDKKLLSAGVSNSATLFDDNDLQVTFLDGSECGTGGLKRSTDVLITCDPKVYGLQLETAAEGPVCMYNIFGRSSLACNLHASQHPCVYEVEGKRYDLSNEQPYTIDLANHYKYTIDLCVAHAISATDHDGGSYVSQYAPPAKSAHSMFSGIQVRNVVSLGRTITRKNADARTATFSYTEGDVCAGFTPRSTQVHVMCGPKHRFVNATEPSHCTYVLHVESPFACPESAKKI
jgi:hypothetical protein